MKVNDYVCRCILLFRERHFFAKKLENFVHGKLFSSPFYFPPLAMFTRIRMSTVAWYEIFISIIILIGSTVGIGVLSAKIYRVGVLLYGTPPRFTKIIKEVFKKQ